MLIKRFINACRLSTMWGFLSNDIGVRATFAMLVERGFGATAGYHITAYKFNRRFFPNFFSFGQVVFVLHGRGNLNAKVSTNH